MQYKLLKIQNNAEQSKLNVLQSFIIFCDVSKIEDKVAD